MKFIVYFDPGTEVAGMVDFVSIYSSSAAEEEEEPLFTFTGTAFPGVALPSIRVPGPSFYVKFYGNYSIVGAEVSIFDQSSSSCIY